MAIEHPIVKGDRLMSLKGEICDDGHGAILSTGENAIGVLENYKYDEFRGFTYQVYFPESLVWVVLDETDLEDVARYVYPIQSEPLWEETQTRAHHVTVKRRVRAPTQELAAAAFARGEGEVVDTQIGERIFPNVENSKIAPCG